MKPLRNFFLILILIPFNVFGVGQAAASRYVEWKVPVQSDLFVPIQNRNCPLNINENFIMVRASIDGSQFLIGQEKRQNQHRNLTGRWNQKDSHRTMSGLMFNLDYG